MVSKRIGMQTMVIQRAAIHSYAAVVGKKEGEGPLGNEFDDVIVDDTLGQKSWEKAESEMFLDVVKRCVTKSGKRMEDVEFLLGGDLLNQIISSSFAARQIGRPFLGLYGACSTMAESLALGAMMVDGGFSDCLMCATSSHFCTAERQYRFPLEMGTQRPPTSQWTVTGAGATMLVSSGGGAHISGVTIGQVVDFGIADVNNMGAAMAPAAAHTFVTHLTDTGRKPEDYDLIVTGDLGAIGTKLFLELVGEEGINLPQDRHLDCGLAIFAPEQDTHSGGSGCGCSASVLNSHILTKLFSGELKRILFMATGALLSPTSSQQGETVPSIAHAVVIETGGVIE